MKAGALVKNLLFPKRCIYCGAVVGFAPGCRCAPQLETCRRPVGGEVVAEAQCKLRFVQAAAAVYAYQTPVTTGLARLKFEGKEYLAEPYGRQMAQAVLRVWGAGAFDFIVPVPSTAAEIRRRGYDVPVKLAYSMGFALAIPVCSDILKKDYETARQHELPLSQRKVNLLGAFSVVTSEKLQGANVLICDDILTTGATLEECAKMLQIGGAKAVYGIVFAATPKQKP